MILTKLKQHREAQGMTPEELAVKVGLTVRTIQNVESGKSCTTNNARRFAKVFRVKLEELE